MKIERKRIYIGNLPESATEKEITDAFNNYGQVQNVEIKKRNELSASGNNTTTHFCFVNLESDQRDLQRCFKDFADGKWLGEYVSLQIARESFLERIKREREENDNKKDVSNQNICLPEKKVKKEYSNGKINDEITLNNNEDDVDYKIINNKEKVLESIIKIEPTTNQVVDKNDLNDKKDTNNMSESNKKRLESLKQQKQNYRQQKNLIKFALSKIDNLNNKKILFDENESLDNKNDGKSSKALFEDNDDEDFEANFDVKEHFEGKDGQRLFELQSKYKNDKRFALDSRFLDDDDNNDENEENDLKQDEEESLEEEKKKQLEILQGVLNSKPLLKNPKKFEGNKKMLRFDPSQPEHSKYELPKETKRKKEITKENLAIKVKKQEEKEAPVVSKDVFYKVNENIKENLQTNEGFSLLNMFGVASEENKDNDEEQVEETLLKQNVNVKEVNPFKYDSSDDEEPPDNTYEIKNKSAGTFEWCERLFFKEDDYRLQEGFDFIGKMKEDNGSEDFTKVRRDLKNIVKAKVRNNKAKKKPFKKKLGGSKKKKLIRIKKALKK